jgi:hypothetical protein
VKALGSGKRKVRGRDYIEAQEGQGSHPVPTEPQNAYGVNADALASLTGAPPVPCPVRCAWDTTPTSTIVTTPLTLQTCTSVHEVK